MSTRMPNGLRFGMLGLALFALAACSDQALTGPSGEDSLTRIERAEIADQVAAEQLKGPDLPPATGRMGADDEGVQKPHLRPEF